MIVNGKTECCSNKFPLDLHIGLIDKKKHFNSINIAKIADRQADELVDLLFSSQ